MDQPLFTRKNCGQCFIFLVIALLSLWALCVGLTGLATGQGPGPLTTADMVAFCLWGGHADAILWTGGANGWACVNATNQVWMIDQIYEGYNSVCTIRDGVPSVAENLTEDPFQWYCQPVPATPEPTTEPALIPSSEPVVPIEAPVPPATHEPQMGTQLGGPPLEEMLLQRMLALFLSNWQQILSQAIWNLR